MLQLLSGKRGKELCANFVDATKDNFAFSKIPVSVDKCISSGLTDMYRVSKLAWRSTHTSQEYSTGKEG